MVLPFDRSLEGPSLVKFGMCRWRSKRILGPRRKGISESRDYEIESKWKRHVKGKDKRGKPNWPLPRIPFTVTCPATRRDYTVIVTRPGNSGSHYLQNWIVELQSRQRQGNSKDYIFLSFIFPGCG